jgi:hypothetical protein
MNALKDLLGRKRTIVGIAIVVGIGLGLLFGWVITPVKWINAEPKDLRADLRQDYLRMVIDSYSVNSDGDLALERYQGLGDTGSQTLADVAAQPDEVDPTAIQRFRAAIEILGPETTGGNTEGGTAAGSGSFARYVFPVCGIAVVLGVLLALALYFRKRMSAGAEPPPLDQAFEETGGDFAPGLGFAAEEGTLGREPLATFRTTYTIGDDLYDDSFSIETPAGDFVGECGVGIGDVIGVGDPKKASAFEVWLFDKNDIQTVTKVLMSRYSFSDDSARNRLAAKGDPVEAQSGGVILLETASLEVEARIVDMTYGEGPLPPSSYFERLTIELRAWPRVGAL